MQKMAHAQHTSTGVAFSNDAMTHLKPKKKSSGARGGGGGRPKARRSSYSYGEETHGLDAKQVFEKYDADGSGTIEPDELKDALYDLGIRLTEENILKVRHACGARTKTQPIGFRAFLAWYQSGPAKSKALKDSKLDKLAGEVRSEYLPWIKHLFSAADEDDSGALDQFEYADFYPTLVEYMEINGGHKLPPLEECLEQMDAISGNGINSGNGMVEYEEFEAWYLSLEMQRAKDSAKALDTIKSARVDIRGLMKTFGTDTSKKAKGAKVKRKTIAEKFNYEDVSFNAQEIFEKYDVDDSSTIDAHELEDMLFELGIKCTKANLEKARKDLGITKYSGEVDFFTFEEWWNKGYGHKASTKLAILSRLSEKMKFEYLPYIRAMFAEADKDRSGELDNAEFQVFYPKLREYLGYPIPPVVQCMNEVDTYSGNGGVFGDGLIQYEEFESWFLAMELKRAQASAHDGV